MMASCYFCGGDLREELTTFIYQEGERIFLVKNVPEWVCQKCGEKEYSQHVTHRVVTLLRHSPRSYEIAQVPLYDLALAGAS